MKKMEKPIQDLISSITFEKEFGHLKGACYLDHTGAALYAKSQLEAVTRDLCENAFSNPHSNSLSSKLCCDTVDQVRYRILQHFNTTSSHYSVIFTSGATEALKTVAETFDFIGSTQNELLPIENSTESCGKFVYLEDNHTSVLGMRNVDNVVKNKVEVTTLQHLEAFETFSCFNETNNGNNIPIGSDTGQSEEMVTKHISGNSLFVYAAQCNFSGLKYPLSWIELVQEGALNKNWGKPESECTWYCLLDAATYVSSNVLDLSVYNPDFVAISFYKMFGFPTGLGALLVRNSSAPVLIKKYFGGGTVQMALASRPTHVLRPVLHERFEDGTINFLSIIALRHGFDWFDRAGLNMHIVSQHCFLLAQYTFSHLRRLHHANGFEAACVYADTAYDDQATQGGIVNFNMIRDTGEFVGCNEVLTLSNLHGIHLRTGCFCNPGACQRLLKISDDEYLKNFVAGHVCGDDRDLIEGHPTGSVRVSFGPYSTLKDADNLINMLIECFVTKPAKYTDPNNWELTKEKLRQKFADLKINKRKEHTNGGQNGKVNVENKTLNTNLVKIHFQNVNLSYKNSCSPESGLTLSQICLYPVKSCGGLNVDSWPLDERGLLYDRCWMVVNDSGVALTQKQDSRMCLIKPQVHLDKGVLTLTFKGESSCSVPLEMSSSEVSEAWLCQSKVCGDNVQALDCGEEAASWLSKVLGRPGLRLTRQSGSALRPAKNSAGPTTTSLTLSNQAQFLLVNENSVLWLAEKLPQDSGCSKTNLVDRFRSNLVITGNCSAFEEQKWSQVKIGSVMFKVDGPCGRCQMICIDQSTGVKTKEPLTTLAANSQGRMKFGIYLSQERITPHNCVTVGDSVMPSVT